MAEDSAEAAPHADNSHQAGFPDRVTLQGRTYLPEGPFPNRDAFIASIVEKVPSTELICYAVMIPTLEPEGTIEEHNGKREAYQMAGFVCFCKIEPAHRRVELGVIYSHLVQRSTASTEAIYLLARYAFDTLGYRRLEWRCDSLNAASNAAALRLGFTKEGLFRQHAIYRGKTRDTACYAMLYSDWKHPGNGRGGTKVAFEKWLDAANFDEDGRQRMRLEEFRK